jgi:lysozyme
MPMAIAKPRFADLSPDLQYQIWRRQQWRDYLFYGALLPLMAYLTIPAVNRWVDSQIGVTRQVQMEAVHPSSGALPPALQSTPQVGDEIAGFAITSPYGDRSDRAAVLPPGASLFHYGVDLATPVGTPVYAMGATTVTCWTDGGGGGLVAEVTSTEIADYRFQLLHLSDCFEGSHGSGAIIAKTGDSGIGAAHLDFRQEHRLSGQKVPPAQGYIQWALTGRAPASTPVGVVEAIKQYEGLSLNAYLDPVGVPTIGYGATTYPDGSPVRLGDQITATEAEELLYWHLEQVAHEVDALVTVPLAVHERAALLDFTYNVGSANLARSTLLQKLNQGDKSGASQEFGRWIHGDGQVLPGLVLRRKENAQLFQGP